MKKIQVLLGRGIDMLTLTAEQEKAILEGRPVDLTNFTEELVEELIGLSFNTNYTPYSKETSEAE